MPVNAPDDPGLRPWLPRQPLEADRLDRWQSQTVMDVRAGPGVRITRKGNSVTIALAERPRPRFSGIFPVKVEKTGGSDGTAITTASWTYTVRRVDWTGSGTSADFELGTVVQQIRPRPIGKMIFQTGSTGYGLAFYDVGVLKLWDAGEVPEIGVCP